MKARFTACASGYPEPEVEWFLNGDRIYPNDRTLIEKEPNGKLIIPNTTETNEQFKVLQLNEKIYSLFRFATFNHP